VFNAKRADYASYETVVEELVKELRFSSSREIESPKDQSVLTV
jgi:CCR4-NOT transcriptional regulation complex NOT5 subunit